MIKTIKSVFHRGLFALLPIIMTIVVLNFIIKHTYDFLDDKLLFLRNIMPPSMLKIPGFEILIIIFGIMVIGLLLKYLIIVPIEHWFERLITKIPFIRTVYSAAKTMVDFFNIPESTSTKRKVVLVEFPKPGMFNLGFVLETAMDSFHKVLPAQNQRDGKTYYKVFMPNTPNPTTGYFMILSNDQITHTNISFEEAMKTIVSCGLITPDSLKQ